MLDRLFTFVGGRHGLWSVVRCEPVVGAGLEAVERLEVVSGSIAGIASGHKWLLRGVTSHERYVHQLEQEQLQAIQPPLARPEATCAALIPVKKSALWWALPQDKRRAIFEEQSHHTATGMKYLPTIARRLHHGYDLGEPFDFLTWFEYAPAHAQTFEELVAILRSSEEWKYVEREVDIRLIRSS